MDQKLIRIGILADHVHASKYVRDVVEWAKSTPGLAITHLLVHPPRSDILLSRTEKLKRKFNKLLTRNGLYTAVSRQVFKFLIVFEKIQLKRIPRHRDHDAKFDLRDLISETIFLIPEISVSGLSYRFNSTDIDTLRSIGFDVLIRCGGGILRGEILSVARFGVVSFHHADNRINRGTPAGFWEVYHQQDTTGFTLQRLSEELDGGEVLMRGNFPTRHYFLLNQAALYEKSNHYLKTLLADIAAGKICSAIPSIPYSERLFRAPLAHQSIAYLWRSVSALAAKKIRKVRNRSEFWQVSFLRASWRNSVLWKGTVIPNPPGRYLADPFVISRGGKNYCFVEDYDCRAARGRISVYELGVDDADPLGVVIEERFHLSFPYLFEYSGALYMCPESSANHDIRVYRCLEFPMHWQLETTIMSNVSAVDTMLFEWQGKWWMFTNMDPAGTGEICSELFIFSSTSPLSTSWQAHTCNPILVDASCARNGGLLRDEGKLFRVSQRQGFDRYGKSSQINEIVQLSDDVYEEKCIAIINPKFGTGLLGTHHFHSVDNVTVFDSLACGPRS